MTITEFLEARIAEDEAQAEACRQLGWGIAEKYGITAISFDRVLAECAAKRAIIESHQNISSALGKESELSNRLMLDGMEAGMRMALMALTFPYKDQPDWNAEWANYGG